MAKEKVKFDITELSFLYDNILVRQVDVLTTEEDIFVDPKQYSDKPEIGRVISTGPGRLADNGTISPIAVKAGDIVLFNKYSSVKYRNKATSEDLYIVREEDIVGSLSQTR